MLTGEDPIRRLPASRRRPPRTGVNPTAMLGVEDMSAFEPIVSFMRARPLKARPSVEEHEAGDRGAGITYSRRGVRDIVGAS